MASMKGLSRRFLPPFGALLLAAGGLLWCTGCQPRVPSGGHEPGTVTLTYDGNGCGCGYLPVPGAGAVGQRVAVQGNAGGLYRPGDVFKGWNTRADGFGVTYRPRDLVVLPNGGMVVFARWSPGPTYPAIFRNPEGELR